MFLRYLIVKYKIPFCFEFVSPTVNYTGQQKNSFSFKQEQEHSFPGNIEALILNLVLVFF